MNSKLKEIIAAGRGLPTTRQAQQRLSDIVERLEQNGGLELNNFVPYSDPAETNLADASRERDREQHRGMKLSVAKASGPANELTKAIFGDTPAKMYFDVKA